jgi:hypothetical protein
MGVSGYVYAIAVSGDEVYVGGRFNSAGGLSTNNVARWNSKTGTCGLPWAEASWGMCYAIAVSGWMCTWVGVSTRWLGILPRRTFNIAKWNSNSWSAVGRRRHGVCMRLQ